MEEDTKRLMQIAAMGSPSLWNNRLGFNNYAGGGPSIGWSDMAGRAWYPPLGKKGGYAISFIDESGETQYWTLPDGATEWKQDKKVVPHERCWPVGPGLEREITWEGVSDITRGCSISEIFEHTGCIPKPEQVSTGATIRDKGETKELWVSAYSDTGPALLAVCRFKGQYVVVTDTDVQVFNYEGRGAYSIGKPPEGCVFGDSGFSPDGSRLVGVYFDPVIRKQLSGFYTAEIFKPDPDKNELACALSFEPLCVIDTSYKQEDYYQYSTGISGEWPVGARFWGDKERRISYVCQNCTPNGGTTFYKVNSSGDEATIPVVSYTGESKASVKVVTPANPTYHYTSEIYKSEASGSFSIGPFSGSYYEMGGQDIGPGGYIIRIFESSRSYTVLSGRPLGKTTSDPKKGVRELVSVSSSSSNANPYPGATTTYSLHNFLDEPLVNYIGYVAVSNSYGDSFTVGGFLQQGSYTPVLFFGEYGTKETGELNYEYIQLAGGGAHSIAGGDLAPLIASLSGSTGTFTVDKWSGTPATRAPAKGVQPMSPGYPAPPRAGSAFDTHISGVDTPDGFVGYIACAEFAYRVGELATIRITTSGLVRLIGEKFVFPSGVPEFPIQELFSQSDTKYDNVELAPPKSVDSARISSVRVGYL